MEFEADGVKGRGRTIVAEGGAVGILNIEEEEDKVKGDIGGEIKMELFAETGVDFFFSTNVRRFGGFQVRTSILS